MHKKFFQAKIHLIVVFLFVGASIAPTALTSINIKSTDGKRYDL